MLSKVLQLNWFKDSNSSSKWQKTTLPRVNLGRDFALDFNASTNAYNNILNVQNIIIIRLESPKVCVSRDYRNY